MLKKDLEKSMVEGCAQNDRLWQEKLYRHFFDTMFSFVLRYTDDREEALDILNYGFFRVFKKIHLFGFQGSLEGWIRKLVFHSVADHFKSKSRSLKFLILEDQDKPVHENTVEKIFAEDILKMVDFLPATTQEVFRLFALEGYTHIEIAARLNISPGTSKWHLSEARRRLRDLLLQYQRI